MFEHTQMQEDADHKLGVRSSNKLIRSLLWLASIFLLAVLPALLMPLSAPASAAAARVNHINASVWPRTYACNRSQVTFNFGAAISLSANRTGENITYVWLSSDGTTMSPVTIQVPAGQTAVAITDTWTLGRGVPNGTYWAQVSVLAPNHISSNRATFTVSC